MEKSPVKQATNVLKSAAAATASSPSPSLMPGLPLPRKADVKDWGALNLSLEDAFLGKVPDFLKTHFDENNSVPFRLIFFTLSRARA